MKVEHDKPDNSKAFIDVSDGAVFEYEEEYYLKIWGNDGDYRAIDLSDGEAIDFESDTIVEEHKAKIVIL